jgi:hypothetical protein
LVAKFIAQAKAEIPDLHIEEVDITERPEVAVKYRAMSTPAVAINGKLEFVGVPKEEQLRRCLLAASESSDVESVG